MSITCWQIYWMTRLDAIQALLAVTAVLSGVAALFIGLLWDEMDEWVHRLFVPFLAALAIFTTAAVLVPSTRQAAAIIALPAIANNQDIQGAAKAVPAAINAQAQEWLSEALSREGGK